ncbi:MAG TPA: DUF3307 domain-containing protein [Balneolales bacterium]|nr:DUF3307 domain-containing protein [Balneolales bacterium]
MDGLLLIKLLAAHTIIDFPLQKNEWIKRRKEDHWKSWTLLFHSLFHGGLAWLFIFQLQAWWIGLIIAVTHWLIDIWKSYQPEEIRFFIIDQCGHISIILILWGLYTGNIILLPMLLSQIKGDVHFWVIVLGYALAIWPVGVIIQQFVRLRFNNSDDTDQGMKEAGKWIGYFERVLVVTLVLVSAYSALGLLIAAKSILRINTEKSSGRKETEYILIGTLMSWSLAILVGILMRKLLMELH